MKLLHKFILFISLAVLLIGCVRKEILDDINLIEGIGFDYFDDKNILGTVLVPVYLPKQAPKNVTFSAKAEIKKSILQDIQRQASDPVVTGSLGVVLFSKELADKVGILPLVDAFQRDPSVGSGLYLATVDGKAKDFLQAQYGIKGNATYISDLLDHNIEVDDLPKTNLQIFLSDFYQQGKTPFIPQLKKIGKNSMAINGISLFSYGKTVDVVAPREMFVFKLLVDKFSNGQHRVKINSGKASVRSIRSSHNFKLTNRNPFEVTIHIKVNGIIEEFTGQDLTPKSMHEIQKQFEQDIEKDSLKLINRFQEKEIDPVGIGHFVKTQTRNFDFKNWRENQYKGAVVKVIANVQIAESGVIE